MGTYFPRTAMDWDDRFSQSLLLSAIVHVVLIFGLQFKAANPELFAREQPLEVVLVNTATTEAPLKPEVLAQANVAGGGDVDAPRQRRSPLPPADEDTPVSVAEAQAAAEVQRLEREARQLMQQIQSSYVVPTPEAEQTTPPPPSAPSMAPEDLVARSLEIARLEARVSQSWEEYQKRPRRMFYAPPAAKYVYAEYENAFERKVERYGETNFPELLRRNHLYGAVKVLTEINWDGSVLSAEVERSSGNKILDAAAVKTVYDAGPYAPFPPELRKFGDTIVISRYLNFTHEERLAASQ